MDAQTVSIRPPNMQVAVFKIIGTSPLVQHKFSQKAQETIREAHAAGSTARSKKKREAKDFRGLYEGSMHRSREGWAGVHAGAFRNALISACRTVGFKMTLAKLSLFVLPDGFDKDSGTPLVRVEGEPRQHESMVRLQSGVCDLRVRAMFEEWSCLLRIRFDADQFTLNDVANLLARVGQQVGIGEGRPDSRDSAGMGWGLFDIEAAP
jgi:hypothetical protein